MLLTEFLKQWNLTLHIHELGSSGWAGSFEPALETWDDDGDRVEVYIRAPTQEECIQAVCTAISGDGDLFTSDEDGDVDDSINLHYTQIVFSFNSPMRVETPPAELESDPETPLHEDEPWLS